MKLLRQLELLFGAAPQPRKARERPGTPAPERPNTTAPERPGTTALERRGTPRRVQLASGVLPYRFVRAKRRSIGLYIQRGEVEARAPRWVAVADVEAFMRAKERWITRRLAEVVHEPPPFRWGDGERLPLLGRPARLTAAPGATPVHLADERLMLPMASLAGWRSLTLDWLRQRALELFHERVRHYAAKLGVAEPTLGLSNAKTQWGSCWRRRGKHGRVLLNWRLVHLPPHLVDYVVAHELAHLKELNHSARFWAVVESLYPDYRAARKELNRLGRQLPNL